MSERHPRLTILTTSVIALVLTVVPLPMWGSIARPQCLVLTVIFWSTMVPRTAGVLLGWLGGIALDILQGSPLGEHALALAFIAYLAIRLNLLVRAKPLFEQSLFVFAALVAYETLLWVLDGWSGHPLSSPWRWLHTVTGALLWPLIAGILGRFYTVR